MATRAKCCGALNRQIINSFNCNCGFSHCNTKSPCVLLTGSMEDDAR